MNKLKIAVNGAAGRMGRRIIALIAKDDRYQLDCALERSDSEAVGQDAGHVAGVGAMGVNITPEISPSSKVLIDFTSPEPCLQRLKECSQQSIAAVVGTTGFDNAEEKQLKNISKQIPILVAPNMSLGVNLMFRLVQKIAAALGESYDIEIVESHHREKKDAPSGTAVKLAESICEARGWDANEIIKHGRNGMVGRRNSSELGMHAVRGGDIVGEHTVIYAGDGERMELTHRASNRNVFAAGALNAAKYLVHQPAGFYTMQDMLNLS